MSLVTSAALALALPLRLLKRRTPRLERLLHMNLEPEELESVQKACSMCDVRLGAYYRWYLQKLIIARQLRHLSKPNIMRDLSIHDRSSYARLERIHSTAGDRGLLVAVPHHAHYILSIIRIAEYLRAKRRVLIFYGSPSTHGGNKLFDHLYSAIFEDDTSNVAVIHDTRAGLASAIRGLNDGAAVIIMPDAHKHATDTYIVPFCGRPLNVMLGTAVLARRTGSMIAPAVPRACEHRLRFSTHFAEPIEPIKTSTAPSEDPAFLLHRDYTTTARMFQIFEREMSPSIIHWQYVRSHFRSRAEFPVMSPEQLATTAQLLFDDIRFSCLNKPAISMLDRDPAR